MSATCGCVERKGRTTLGFGSIHSVSPEAQLTIFHRVGRPLENCVTDACFQKSATAVNPKGSSRGTFPSSALVSPARRFSATAGRPQKGIAAPSIEDSPRGGFASVVTRTSSRGNWCQVESSSPVATEASSRGTWCHAEFSNPAAIETSAGGTVDKSPSRGQSPEGLVLSRACPPCNDQDQFQEGLALSRPHPP